MTIAERIKKIRDIFDITSQEFSKITGIHHVSIRKYETNKMIPGNDIIEKMSASMRLPKNIILNSGLPSPADIWTWTSILVASIPLKIIEFKEIMIFIL